jgi:hypothetical protein
MKSALAILAMVAAALILSLFYLGKTLEPPTGGTEELPPLKKFLGPVSGTATDTKAGSGFRPPVFIGPSAEPKIIGPKSDPPAPVSGPEGS